MTPNLHSFADELEKTALSAQAAMMPLSAIVGAALGGSTAGEGNRIKGALLGGGVGAGAAYGLGALGKRLGGSPHASMNMALGGGALAGMLGGRVARAATASNPREQSSSQNAWADEMNEQGNLDKFNDLMSAQAKKTYGKPLNRLNDQELDDLRVRTLNHPHFAQISSRHHGGGR